MIKRLKKLGPGILFAGAAIGVSHLVQSTRAGADFGFGLLWALLLVNLFKYPFFQYGPRYAMATGESLVDGYQRLGKPILVTYFLLTFTTMFTIQTAVTIVTASLASEVIMAFKSIHIFGFLISSIQIWTVLILGICCIILSLGKYKFLDALMKVIVLVLTVCTLLAIFNSAYTNETLIDFAQVFPKEDQWVFLIAFMGWMPAPLDISIWHSLWSLEKQKNETSFKTKSALFDFNIGYITTLILGIGFLALGALVLYTSSETLSDSASTFSSQLINMYAQSLGSWAYAIIGIAAFTTMFSTTLTTLDASPRVLDRTTCILKKQVTTKTYSIWLLVLTFGTLVIFFFLSAELSILVKVATVVSFLTAPFYAIANFKLITSDHVKKEWQPKLRLRILSWCGIIFLIGFSLWYLFIIW
jgi:Mn2+/Fe2+ NRAMP family transporter